MADNANAAAQQNGGGGFSALFGNISRMLLMYFLFTSFFGAKKPTVDPASGEPLPPIKCNSVPGQQLSLRVFVDESADFADFDNPDKLIWAEDDLYFDSRESNYRSKNITINLSEAVQNNGTLYSHAFLFNAGAVIDPSSPMYEHLAVQRKTRLLNVYYPKPKPSLKVNLLSGTTLHSAATGDDSSSSTASAATPDPTYSSSNDNNNNSNSSNNETEVEYVSFWKPTLALHIVDDHSVYAHGSLPAQIRDLMTLDLNGNYYPILAHNEFWLLRSQLIPINSSTPSVSLEMSFTTIGLLKWTMMVQMEQSWAMQYSMGLANDNESDDFKQMLMDTNPYLLGLTVAVSLLHMVFDFLAFKNDIAFWKDNKSMEGLSVRSVVGNFGMQLVIFLYLFDNNTSWMILISSFIGLFIEAWKITKACDVTVDWSRWYFPLNFADKESYSNSATKEYDVEATRYLSYLLYPLMVGCAIYSLVYETHKGFYSWILSSVVSCIYTFGFISMTPQLFINYKLKSVAHLPWRTFVYKALNTFIDDLFAFIIKMPMLHRLSCFRDDIVFFIFLYQWWIYPTDHSRVNEFGQGGVQSTSGALTATTTATSSAVTSTINSSSAQTSTTTTAAATGSGIRKRARAAN